MTYIKDFFKGILIGAGAILPGISSGVLCVIFGIYETLLNCVLNFFKNIKENFKFLFPIICGVIVRHHTFREYSKIFIFCLSNTNKIHIHRFNFRKYTSFNKRSYL